MTLKITQANKAAVLEKLKAGRNDEGQNEHDGHSPHAGLGILLKAG